MSAYQEPQRPNKLWCWIAYANSFFLFLAILCLLIFPRSAHASDKTDENKISWTNNSICATGIYYYFFLKKTPDYMSKSDIWAEFRSEAGHTYRCRLEAGMIKISWKRDDGYPMYSEAVKYQISEDILQLKNDTWDKVGVNSTKSFILTEGGIVSL